MPKKIKPFTDQTVKNFKSDKEKNYKKFDGQVTDLHLLIEKTSIKR